MNGGMGAGNITVTISLEGTDKFLSALKNVDTQVSRTAKLMQTNLTSALNASKTAFVQTAGAASQLQQGMVQVSGVLASTQKGFANLDSAIQGQAAALGEQAGAIEIVTSAGGKFIQTLGTMKKSYELVAFAQKTWQSGFGPLSLAIAAVTASLTIFNKKVDERVNAINKYKSIMIEEIDIVIKMADRYGDLKNKKNLTVDEALELIDLTVKLKKAFGDEADSVKNLSENYEQLYEEWKNKKRWNLYDEVDELLTRVKKIEFWEKEPFTQFKRSLGEVNEETEALKNKMIEFVFKARELEESTNNAASGLDQLSESERKALEEKLRHAETMQIFANAGITAEQTVRDNIDALEKILPSLQGSNFEYDQAVLALSAYYTQLGLANPYIGEQAVLQQQLAAAGITSEAVIRTQIDALAALLPHLEKGSFDYNQVVGALQQLHDALGETCPYIIEQSDEMKALNDIATDYLETLNEENDLLPKIRDSRSQVSAAMSECGDELKTAEEALTGFASKEEALNAIGIQTTGQLNGQKDMLKNIAIAFNLTEEEAGELEKKLKALDGKTVDNSKSWKTYGSLLSGIVGKLGKTGQAISKVANFAMDLVTSGFNPLQMGLSALSFGLDLFSKKEEHVEVSMEDFIDGLGRLGDAVTATQERFEGLDSSYKTDYLQSYADELERLKERGRELTEELENMPHIEYTIHGETIFVSHTRGWQRVHNAQQSVIASIEEYEAKMTSLMEAFTFETNFDETKNELQELTDQAVQMVDYFGGTGGFSGFAELLSESIQSGEAQLSQLDEQSQAYKDLEAQVTAAKNALARLEGRYSDIIPPMNDAQRALYDQIETYEDMIARMEERGADPKAIRELRGELRELKQEFNELHKAESKRRSIEAGLAKAGIKTEDAIRGEIAELEKLAGRLDVGSFEYTKLQEKISGLYKQLGETSAWQAQVDAAKLLEKEINDLEKSIENMEIEQGKIDDQLALDIEPIQGNIDEIQALMNSLQIGDIGLDEFYQQLEAITGSVHEFQVAWEDALGGTMQEYDQFGKDMETAQKAIEKLTYFGVELDTTTADEQIAGMIIKLRESLADLNPDSEAYKERLAAIDTLEKKFTDMGGVVDAERAAEVAVEVATDEAQTQVDELQTMIDDLIAEAEEKKAKIDLDISEAKARLAELQDEYNRIMADIEGTHAPSGQGALTGVLTPGVEPISAGTTELSGDDSKTDAKDEGEFIRSQKKQKTVEIELTPAEEGIEILNSDVEKLNNTVEGGASLKIDNSEAIKQTEKVSESLKDVKETLEKSGDVQMAVVSDEASKEIEQLGARIEEINEEASLTVSADAAVAGELMDQIQTGLEGVEDIVAPKIDVHEISEGVAFLNDQFKSSGIECPVNVDTGPVVQSLEELEGQVKLIGLEDAIRSDLDAAKSSLDEFSAEVQGMAPEKIGLDDAVRSDFDMAKSSLDEFSVEVQGMVPEKIGLDNAIRSDFDMAKSSLDEFSVEIQGMAPEKIGLDDAIGGEMDEALTGLEAMHDHLQGMMEYLGTPAKMELDTESTLTQFQELMTSLDAMEDPKVDMGTNAPEVEEQVDALKAALDALPDQKSVHLDFSAAGAMVGAGVSKLHGGGIVGVRAFHGGGIVTAHDGLIVGGSSMQLNPGETLIKAMRNVLTLIPATAVLGKALFCVAFGSEGASLIHREGKQSGYGKPGEFGFKDLLAALQDVIRAVMRLWHFFERRKS